MTILIVTDNPVLNIGLRTIIVGEFPDITIFEAETLQKTLSLTFPQSVNTMILDGVTDGKDIANTAFPYRRRPRKPGAQSEGETCRRLARSQQNQPRYCPYCRNRTEGTGALQAQDLSEVAGT
jgi:hypothetical protein